MNANFANTCEWFGDNKISVHFGADKAKSIPFVSKSKNKYVKKLKL